MAVGGRRPPSPVTPLPRISDTNKVQILTMALCGRQPGFTEGIGRKLRHGIRRHPAKQTSHQYSGGH